MQLGFSNELIVFFRLSNFPLKPLTLFPNIENDKMFLFPFPLPLLVFCFNFESNNWRDFPPFATSVRTGWGASSRSLGLAKDSFEVDSSGVKKAAQTSAGGKMVGARESSG